MQRSFCLVMMVYYGADEDNDDYNTISPIFTGEDTYDTLQRLTQWLLSFKEQVGETNIYYAELQEWHGDKDTTPTHFEDHWGRMDTPQLLLTIFCPIAALPQSKEQ